jgi:hypothetical protein
MGPTAQKGQWDSIRVSSCRLITPYLIFAKWPTRCNCVEYFIVPWLLYMFRAIFVLIIRSILTVITASGFIHVCRCRLLSWLSRNWRNMFRAIFSLIIRRILTVFTASGFIHVCRCQLLSWLGRNWRRCNCVEYFIVPWRLYMFRAIFSLIIRRILTVFTASGFIHMCRCELLSWLSRNWRSQSRNNKVFYTAASSAVPTQPRQQLTTTHVNKTRSCKYS